MLPQPASPKFKTALLEIYVRSAPYGGADKSSNGHRYDSVPFVNGMIGAGMSCQTIHYLHEEHDKFFEICAKFDALIVRCNPGQIAQDVAVLAQMRTGQAQRRAAQPGRRGRRQQPGEPGQPGGGQGACAFTGGLGDDGLLGVGSARRLRRGVDYSRSASAPAVAGRRRPQGRERSRMKPPRGSDMVAPA